MAAELKFLAFDLGAESGRAVVARFDGARLRLDEAHRFANEPVRVLDTLYWDPLRLFAELKRGLAKAVSQHGTDIAGIGIDTWGVDFGLLGRDDALLGNPRHYRDHGNDGIVDVAFRAIPREALFQRTGIQFMQFNTLFQLLALKRAESPILDSARTLLMMPDLLAFWLTGLKSSEYSIATTTQMYDPRSRGWATDVLETLGLPAGLLTNVVPPGTILGQVRPAVAEDAGCGAISVICPAEHDTGSAVAAVPATGPDFAYISSGTWSLMGIEAAEPVISDRTLAANFTNEGSASGGIRLLKNIMGLWLVQECRRSFVKRGSDLSYAELTRLAAEATPFRAIVDPDDPAFLAPADMPDALRSFCRRTGQPELAGAGELVRCCLESLALKYRWVLERLEAFRGKRIEVIHIVGGGAQNRLLSRFTADATERPVIAGPTEATGIGNALMQAVGLGRLASVDEGRAVVRDSFELETFEPGHDGDAWPAAYARFRGLAGA